MHSRERLCACVHIPSACTPVNIRACLLCTQHVCVWGGRSDILQLHVQAAHASDFLSSVQLPYTTEWTCGCVAMSANETIGIYYYRISSGITITHPGRNRSLS